MEDLKKIYELAESYPRELEKITEEHLLKLRVFLWGQAAVPTAAKEKVQDLPAASPQQTKKRVKRLTSLNELEETDENVPSNSVDNKKSEKSQSPRKSKRSNADLLASADAIDATEAAPVPAPRTQVEDVETNATITAGRTSDATNLMPPPPAPLIAPAPTLDDTSSGRPQRAAKLKSEKNLKEQGLRGKLRRPTNEEIKVKLEHEHRPSQMHESGCDVVAKSKKQSSASENVLKESLASSQSDESLLVVSSKQPSIVSIDSDLEDAVVQKTAANSTTEKSQDKDATHTQKKTYQCSIVENSLESSDTAVRELRIKIKREKVSLNNPEETKDSTATKDDDLFKAPGLLPASMEMNKNETATIDETSSLASTILSSTTNTTTAAPAKKSRKKKEVHKPIKVERFSDLDPKPSPISSRTRHGSIGKSNQHEEEVNTVSSLAETKRPGSIYEDAIETPPSRHSKDDRSKIVNETANVIGLANDATMNLGSVPADATINLGPVPGDATFCNDPAQTTFQVAPGQTTFVMDSNNPNATVTLNKHSGAGAVADATFDIHQLSKAARDEDAAGQRSFETAKDSSMPHDDSLLTEDESGEPEKPVVATKSKISNASVKSSASSKSSVSAKTAYKMPTRTNELFNPLAQSPVKMRVEAFENAAAAATEQSRRPLRVKKENVTPSTTTTPVIGKLPPPALGRFLTPTQGSNIATHNSAVAKKGVTSASKALPMPKSASASSLQRSNSAASTKTLQRENSADDFRKGLHNLAEERKKQREQKHLLAAQQREAKERERAERMAKLAKEREEKRLVKKQQEQEQKKRELDEIQRKLRQQQEEEAAKQKAAKERELLMQMKQQQLAKQRMMPPPQKTSSKYGFEMLHEDDSTDDEDKVSYKRPPPPKWSRSHFRGPSLLKQEYTPAAIIDSFFSVQPMTPDLKSIFPNIDARHLKRNSSVLWSTPPRYSELPKY